jgi:hypothetical protein
MILLPCKIIQRSAKSHPEKIKNTANEGDTMDVKTKLEDVLEVTRINELLNKKEAENAKKPSNVILWILAVIGAVAAVAAIAYVVYCYLIPDYEGDFDDDYDDFDDFDDFDDEKV